MQISIHSKRFHAIWLLGVDAAPSEVEEEAEGQMVVHLAGGDLSLAPVEEVIWEEEEEASLGFGFQPQPSKIESRGTDHG